MTEPGRVIGRGRRADIYDIGHGRVLRRYREGPRDVALEAEVMRHARGHGVPVPEVFDTVGDTDLVMELVSGPTMLADLTRRPWTLATHSRLLGQLHNLVHAVPALDGMRAPFGPGGSLLHFDLHPLNVVLTSRGPVIIDWEGAGQGPPEADVALSWLLIRFSDVPGPLPEWVVGTAAQSSFAALFRRNAGPISNHWITEVSRFRLLEPTVTPKERLRIERLLAGGAQP